MKYRLEAIPHRSFLVMYKGGLSTIRFRTVTVADNDRPLSKYAYYIYGVGHHTEDDCRAEDTLMQVYRPLYENSYAYQNGSLFDIRSLYIFYKPAGWNERDITLHEDHRPGGHRRTTGDETRMHCDL